MKRLSLFLFIAATLLSFGVANAQKESKVYSVDEFKKEAPKLAEQTIQIKGKATHVCATSGRKLFLANESGKQTVQINSSKELGKYDKNVVGKMVIATATVKENRITMEMLNAQETKAIEAEKVKKEAAHCESEAKAEGHDITLSPVKRIQLQKEKLEKQIKEGKQPYLATYTLYKCTDYKVVE